MFKKRSKGAPGVTDTLIGAGTEMNGQLKSEAGVRIEGAYHGDIESKGDVVVGEGGVARSNMTARDVTIAGKVYGDVHTHGKLIITATGQLHGNSYATVLLVQEGGVLNGGSRMDGAETKPASAPPDLPSAALPASAGHMEKKAKQAG
ncbi:polymer-forming cytoskeletal protein [Paenibacillaceae bacterium WGS1546]|uniref:bactofilin family protein n=1 Tax=Cohnella sp. WGS1546 TaxID=3366810 RepID=UPI00372CED24